MAHRISRLLVWLTLAAAVFAPYYHALAVGFYGDDWIFFDLAGRLSLPDYLVRYFDPNAQTAWYRPVQGLLFRLEYTLWGNHTVPYHARNLFFHFANCLWLFAIVERVTRQRFAAFTAALMFATLPTAAIAVFWPGVVDPMETFFYLASIWFWLAHLQSTRARDYWLAFAAFLFALLSKEIGATLPITLFLIDRLIIGKPASLTQFMRRYFWFAMVYLIYLPIEFIVTRRSVFVNREGYAASTQLWTNLFDYLGALVFPWAFVPFLSYVLVLIAAGFLGYLIFVRQKLALIPIVVGATLAILPVIPFPFVAYRFLYLSLIGSAILFALGLNWVKHRLPTQRFYQTTILGMLAAIVLFGGARVSDAALGFGENARIARVPFRNFRQAHPTLPDETFVYFLYPPVPGPNLSGMFLWYYGPRVFAGANDSDLPRRLRDYPLTYVQYFDESGNQKEQRVDKELNVRFTPTLPVSFSPAIRLEDVELVSANVPRGETVILLLHWRALASIADDYTVGVSLIDSSGKSLSMYLKEPRRGQSPTSSWTPGQIILDAIQLPVPADALPGAYHVEITLFDAAKPSTGNLFVTIEPVNIAK
jgi:hypothetical protein